MDAIARVAFGLNVDSQKEKNNKFVTIINSAFDSISDGVSPAVFLLGRLLINNMGVGKLHSDQDIKCVFETSVISTRAKSRTKKTSRKIET